MTNKERVEEIRQELIMHLNCTDDKDLKEKLLYILNGDRITLCKCPMCGETFDTDENMKHSAKVLPL